LPEPIARLVHGARQREIHKLNNAVPRGSCRWRVLQSAAPQG
jgi:hypothetical protein